MGVGVGVRVRVKEWDKWTGTSSFKNSQTPLHSHRHLGYLSHSYLDSSLSFVLPFFYSSSLFIYFPISFPITINNNITPYCIHIRPIHPFVSFFLSLSLTLSLSLSPSISLNIFTSHIHTMAPVQAIPKSDLLFNAALIPAELQSRLPAGYVLRPLARTDNQLRANTSFLKTLEVLTTVGTISDADFQKRFTYLQQHNDQYFTIVIEDMNGPVGSPSEGTLVAPGRGKIVAAGTVLVERKFIHELGLVGHIEDIAVSADQQGKKLGLRIIETLKAIGEQVGCYKVILDCSEKNVPFYEKCGFERKGVEMGWYVKKPVQAKL